MQPELHGHDAGDGHVAATDRAGTERPLSDREQRLLVEIRIERSQTTGPLTLPSASTMICTFTWP